jgi:hypothetical protein
VSSTLNNNIKQAINQTQTQLWCLRRSFIDSNSKIIKSFDKDIAKREMRIDKNGENCNEI